MQLLNVEFPGRHVPFGGERRGDACGLSEHHHARTRAIWKDKALWINFPSSVHLRPVEEVAQTMRDILRDAGDGRRFLVGITEDVPEDRWKGSYQAIMGVLIDAGRVPFWP